MRLFVAVAVPRAAREAVAAAAAPLRSMGADVRWTDLTGWHLTVAFLGQTDPTMRSGLASALAEVAARFTPFEVQLRPVAGRGVRSHVLWIELEPCEPLQEVAAAIGVALRGLGWSVEDRAFRPHLTLARARASVVPRSLVDAYHGPPVTWTVADLELVRSHLGRAGARYETVASFPFAS
ncbi:MAG: RNA 2',3'-cyclic phosphodiesterase [Egibacteraceae bacterium]